MDFSFAQQFPKFQFKTALHRIKIICCCSSSIVRPATSVRCGNVNMASVSNRTLDNEHTTNSRMTCVACKTFQPRSGKFLTCLHILCDSCLKDSVTLDGSVTCSLCNSTTTGWLCDVDLAQQLVESSPWLYPSPHTDNLTDASSGVTEGADRTLCAPCEDDDLASVATHECRECENRPFCQRHASLHARRCRDRSEPHHLRVLENRHTDHARISPATCPAHADYKFITFCLVCYRLACGQCLHSGTHDGHQMEDIASAAARQRHGLLLHMETNEAVRENVTGEAHFSTETFTTISEIDRGIQLAVDDGCKQSEVITDHHAKIEAVLLSERERLQEKLRQLIDVQLDVLRRQKHLLASSISRRHSPNEQCDLVTSARNDSDDTKPYSDDRHPSGGAPNASVGHITAIFNIALNEVAPYLTTQVSPIHHVDLETGEVFSHLRHPRRIHMGNQIYAMLPITAAHRRFIVQDGTNVIIRVHASIEAQSPIVYSCGAPVIYQWDEKACAVTRLLIRLSSTNPGAHRLKLYGNGRFLHAVGYTVNFRMRFAQPSPGKECPPQTTCNDRVASNYEGSTRWVVTHEGLYSGVHSWTIRLCDDQLLRQQNVAKCDSPLLFSVGIVSGIIPSRSLGHISFFYRDYASCEYINVRQSSVQGPVAGRFPRLACFWTKNLSLIPDSDALREWEPRWETPHPYEALALDNWTSGDTIAFTLHIDKFGSHSSSLVCSLGGCDLIKKIIRGSPPFFPGVLMYGHGQTAEIS